MFILHSTFQVKKSCLPFWFGLDLIEPNLGKNFLDGVIQPYPIHPDLDHFLQKDNVRCVMIYQPRPDQPAL